MANNPYNLMVPHNQSTAAFHKSPVSLVSYQGQSNAIWAMRADMTTVQGLAEMAHKALLSGNDASPYLSQMMSVADSQGMTSNQLQDALRNVIGKVEAQPIAEQYEAAQDAKRPQNALGHDLWEAPTAMMN